MVQDDYDSPNGTVYQPTVLIEPEKLILPESSRIDAFCLINASGGIEIGEQVHICAGAKVVGSSGMVAEDRSAITYNAVILTSSADLRYPGSAQVPEEERKNRSGAVKLKRESFVGSGAVIMPGVTLGEGAIAAANSYINEDIPPWTIALPDGSYVDREFLGGKP